MFMYSFGFQQEQSKAYVANLQKMIDDSKQLVSDIMWAYIGGGWLIIIIIVWQIWNDFW